MLRSDQFLIFLQLFKLVSERWRHIGTLEKLEEEGAVSEEEGKGEKTKQDRRWREKRAVWQRRKLFATV